MLADAAAVVVGPGRLFAAVDVDCERAIVDRLRVVGVVGRREARRSLAMVDRDHSDQEALEMGVRLGQEASEPVEVSGEVEAGIGVSHWAFDAVAAVPPSSTESISDVTASKSECRHSFALPATTTAHSHSASAPPTATKTTTNNSA